MWVFFFGREKLFFFIFKLSVKWVLLVAVRHCCSCAELLSLLLFFFFFFLGLSPFEVGWRILLWICGFESDFGDGFCSI